MISEEGEERMTVLIPVSEERKKILRGYRGILGIKAEIALDTTSLVGKSVESVKIEGLGLAVHL